MIQLKVLVITSRRILTQGNDVVGDNPFFPLSDPEVEDYLELLSVSSFHFDIKYNDELLLEGIVANGNISYSTIILALPERELTERQIEIIDRLSGEYGVSVIATYNRVGERMKHIFGIETVGGIGIKFPCSIVIKKNEIADKKVERVIKLGRGINIGFQKYGFRRQPIKYILRHLKKIIEQVLTYKKVKLKSEAVTIATIKGEKDTAICRYKYGKATNYYISLYSDSFLDRFDSIHRIVREFIRKNSGWGMVESSLDNSMVLRMDDPGTSQRIYLKNYDTRILTWKEWQSILELLDRYKAGLSVMYVPLWVDGASLKYGRLFVKGREIKNRIIGHTFLSKDVLFKRTTDGNKVKIYDYVSEYKALKSNLKFGRLDIESHGLTHLDTDINKWLSARDRFENWCWWHEFRHVVNNRDCTESEQRKALHESSLLLNKIFSISPSSVTPSGHEQSKDTEKIAHDVGYKLLSSEFHSLKKNNLIIRNDKLTSVFLESVSPDLCYTQSGYTVVGVFHDYDIVKNGVAWLEGTIKKWIENGIEQFITLRELVGNIYTSLEAYQDDKKMVIKADISKTGGVSDRPESRYYYQNRMKINITIPENKVIHSIKIEEEPWNEFQYTAQGHLKLTLPPFKNKDCQEMTLFLE